MLGHIPGAYLAAKFGAKTVLNVGLFLTALFTAITPFVIELGNYALTKHVIRSVKNVVFFLL